MEGHGASGQPMELMDGPAAASGWPRKLLNGQGGLWIGPSEAPVVPMDRTQVELRELKGTRWSSWAPGAANGGSQGKQCEANGPQVELMELMW